MLLKHPIQRRQRRAMPGKSSWFLNSRQNLLTGGRSNALSVVLSYAWKARSPGRKILPTLSIHDADSDKLTHE